jgi:predicted RecA/RadA family phage recombinase
MNVYIQPGEVLTLTAPYTRTSGQGAQVGSIFGVACNDVTSGDEGEFATEGVYTLAKTSAQAWTVGKKIYWDNSNKRCDTDSTIGLLIGVATAVAANPSSTGNVKLNGSAPATSEGPQAAEIDLTDNSGGASADGTIGAVTAPTALTDNGGGTADGTVASQAAPTTLTDNTGGSGTHDDTLAAVTAPTLTDWNGSSVYPSAAQGTAITGAINALKQNQSDAAQKIIEIITLEGVAQNNLKELTTTQGQNRTAIVALTDAVKELSTKQNAILAKLRIFGIIAS